jgi:proline dehydrogenase
MVSFDNTEYAFEYKNDADLKKANFLFSAMGKQWLVKLGTKLTPWAIKNNIPFVKNIVRKTIFSQFVGGETLEQTAAVAKKLGEYNVDIILDYGVEGGEDGEDAYDNARDEFIRVIDYAATQKNIPFISIKVTGLVSFGLLEKLDELMHQHNGNLIVKYHAALEQITEVEKKQWTNLLARVEKVCEAAATKGIGVLVDAEETWIQDPVDAITMLMMDKYNKQKAIVFNTLQLYRHDRLAFLKTSIAAAKERNFIMGAKIVRGAYMEKERKRAEEKGYESPIQSSKENSDKDYNEALTHCIENINNTFVIVASHNEHSNLLATQLLDKFSLPHNHKHLHFSQLYGMSDNITFNLAKDNFSVSKYLPFGPIDDVVPYLMRRAQENSSVSGQTGRELLLIKKELKRRKK